MNEIKKKNLEEMLSPGKDFVEFLRNRDNPEERAHKDAVIDRVRQIGGNLEEMAANTSVDMPTPIGMVGSTIPKTVIRILDEGKVFPVKQFAKTLDDGMSKAIKLHDNGKVVPLEYFTKSADQMARNEALKQVASPSKFIPTKSKAEYLSSIENMKNQGMLTGEKAQELIDAVLKLGIE